MPFLGLHDGTEVIPNQVQKGDLLEYPKCGDQLKIRDSHRLKGSFAARHFSHAAEEKTDCCCESLPFSHNEWLDYVDISRSLHNLDNVNNVGCMYCAHWRLMEVAIIVMDLNEL